MHLSSAKITTKCALWGAFCCIWEFIEIPKYKRTLKIGSPLALESAENLAIIRRSEFPSS